MSQTWFAEKERIVSTAAMAGSGAVGGMIGSVLAPIIVNNDPDNIPVLNTVFPVLRHTTTYNKMRSFLKSYYWMR